MAFYLEKEKTTSTPHIVIDEEKNYLKLDGQCFHENITSLFQEINQWLDNYLKTDFGVFTFDNEIRYCNSSTTKLLYNMLLKMDGFASDKNRVIVNWISNDENEIMIECGEDFKEEMENLEFNLIIKPIDDED